MASKGFLLYQTHVSFPVSGSFLIEIESSIADSPVTTLALGKSAINSVVQHTNFMDKLIHWEGEGHNFGQRHQFVYIGHWRDLSSHPKYICY